jgi:hypothetical protein
MNKRTNKPLVLAFIIVVVVFLMFCGGAVTMTMKNAGVNGSGIMNNISWMWSPAMLALLLSVLLGWTIYWKKND